MMAKKYYWSAFLHAVLMFTVCRGQIQSLPGTSQSTFYLDLTKDCDGRPREVGQSTSMILGKSALPQGKPVTSCTLTLNTENIREPHRFKLQFLAVTIGDPGVYFYVYDGEFNGRLIYSFSKDRNKPSNLDFAFTTGQIVTFKMSRGERDTDYDIRVVAEPVASDVARCTYEGQYGCDEYGYNYRLLGTREIVGIVGGVFAVVVFIVIIVVVCCYRRQRGITQTWKQQKLGHVNTAASLHSLNGKKTASTKPWTSESSKNGFASIRRSPNLPRAKIARSHQRGDGDSTMYNSEASLPMKPRPLPPPQVSHNSRSTSDRGRGRNLRNRGRDDDSFSDRSGSTDRNYSEKNVSDKNYRPPTYREAIRHDDSESADEHTFVQADESHQQTTFVEREIIPRKKKSPILQRFAIPKALPPPEFDETYDTIEPKKTKKALMVEKGTGSSEEETDQSDTDNESEESSEEEEESEVESNDDHKKDEADVVYSKPNKDKSKDDSKNPQQASDQGAQQVFPQGAFRPPLSQHPQQFQSVPYPGYLPPGVRQPQPRYPGFPGPMQPYPQGQPQFPQGQSQYPQGNQPQPHPYHQANFTVPMPPQGAPMMPPNQYAPPPQHKTQPHRDHKSHRDHQPAQVHPSNPPVYSYLVNRGYRPLDGRHSPASTSTGGSNLSGDRNLQADDTDFSANLDSGVELMKRKK